MPPDVNVYDDTLMARAEALAMKWHEADPDRTGACPSDASADDMHEWSVDEKLAFVTRLAQYAADKPLHKDMTRRLDKLYLLDAVRNPEVCTVYTFQDFPRIELNACLCDASRMLMLSEKNMHQLDACLVTHAW
jgi:hypothetical protein